jgi:hypothetical protein
LSLAKTLKGSTFSTVAVRCFALRELRLIALCLRFASAAQGWQNSQWLAPYNGLNTQAHVLHAFVIATSLC